jgi:hypothetical protein
MFLLYTDLGLQNKAQNADHHVAMVRIVEGHASPYQPRSPLIRRPSLLVRCRSPSQNVPPAGAHTFLPKVITRSRSFDAIWEHRDKSNTRFRLVSSSSLVRRIAVSGRSSGKKCHWLFPPKTALWLAAWNI